VSGTGSAIIRAQFIASGLSPLTRRGLVGSQPAGCCWRLEPAAAIFGAGFNDAEGIAPWVAGVEGAFGPGLACDMTAGLVQDGAGVDDALPNSFERFAGAEVDVTGVGSGKAGSPSAIGSQQASRTP